MMVATVSSVTTTFCVVLTEDGVVVLASQLLFYFLFKQSKSDLVLKPCSSVALSYRYFLLCFIPNCLLLPPSVKQVHKQSLG